jgi:hypothetical protein
MNSEKRVRKERDGRLKGGSEEEGKKRGERACSDSESVAHNHQTKKQEPQTQTNPALLSLFATFTNHKKKSKKRQEKK